MKILYIGHYLEQSGWGEGCRNYIRCMVENGLDIVARPFVLSGGCTNLHPSILQAQDNNLNNIDVCIQQVLPHHLSYNSKYKHISLTYLETFNLQYTSWYNKLKLMDQVWFPDQEHCVAFKNDGFNSHHIPQPIDLEKYKKKLPILKNEAINNNYNFYFIGEFNVRKRISAIIKCYYLAFNGNEPVNLVLKCNKPGVDSAQLDQMIQDLVFKIQDSLKLYNNRTQYPEITILTEPFSDDQILALHKSGDCFVSTSYGESVCIPALDAYYTGNQIIASGTGGLLDIADFPCMGEYEPVSGMTETFSDLFTGREQWFDINQNMMISNMRHIYGTKKIVRQKLPNEYSTIGKKIRSALECLK